MLPYWKYSAKFSDLPRVTVSWRVAHQPVRPYTTPPQGRQSTCQMQVNSLPMPDMIPAKSEGHPEPSPRMTTDSVWCL